MYSPVNLCSLCPPNMLCPAGRHPGSCDLGPLVPRASVRSHHTRPAMNNPKPVDLEGTERGADTALGSLGFDRSSFVSRLPCSRGQESGGSGPLLFQDGKARASDRRGVCQPRLLPLDPTAECLFLTTCQRKHPADAELEPDPALSLCNRTAVAATRMKTRDGSVGPSTF